MAAYTDGKNEYSPMNLTSFELDTSVFRVQLVNDQECRWLNDGSNEEFIYFSLDDVKQTPKEAFFMAAPFKFVRKDCPNCNLRPGEPIIQSQFRK